MLRSRKGGRTDEREMKTVLELETGIGKRDDVLSENVGGDLAGEVSH